MRLSYRYIISERKRQNVGCGHLRHILFRYKTIQGIPIENIPLNHKNFKGFCSEEYNSTT